MTALYPPTEPYDTGMLDVGDGNRIYWEVCGNPAGKPAVALHGGPGSGSTPGVRRFFDPAAYRLVLFDQRGCGRSTPHAADPATDMSVNTTDHLVGDIEALRRHLGIDRWLVFGGSWGCVLSLVYAERHPERVSELVLLLLATGRRAETDLLTRGLGRYFPQAWERFRAGVPAAERDGDLAAAYNRLLEDPDPAVRGRAARDWCDWEEAIDVTAPSSGPSRYDDPVFRMAFARIVTHYWRHGSWLEEGIVLREAGRLAGIPGVLVQGSLDPGNLVGTPWELAHAWPGSELVLVDEAAHGLGDPGMAKALVGATGRFAGR
ncbi:prolyl aminopeptidase [Streptomyces sp. 6N223]|uniref:prolyl aminopeptidase n=1 Tax=Streptomyces sp. 6N223 TaxID=3457412 RepID=UPI003FD0CF11